MAITQRPDNLQLPPEGLAARQALRPVEQAERRFDTETPAWGGVHPISGQWEMPDRTASGPTVGFWERSPELWGIVKRDPTPDMADWTAVSPKPAERKGSSGLDPYTLSAARALHAAAAGAAARAKPPTQRLPSGRKSGAGRYTAANGAAAAYKAPAARPALGA